MDKEQKEKVFNFYRIIYGDQLDQDGNFYEGQQMRLTQITQRGTKAVFFTNVNAAISYAQKKQHYADIYHNLSLIKPEVTTGTKEDISCRTVIGLDWDEPGLTPRDIFDRCSKVGLWLNALVSSGNGFHGYFAIKTTDHLQKVEDLTKALAELLGADPKATDATRILRMPYTLNRKDPEHIKPVRIAKAFDADSVRRYSIDYYADKYVKQAQDNNIMNTKLKKIPKCIEEIISSGSPEGQRNQDLMLFVTALRHRGISYDATMKVAKDWAEKSKYFDRLEYQVKYIYENQKQARYNCHGCEDKKICRYNVPSQFEDMGDQITMAEKIARSMKHSNRKGVKQLGSNDMLIYGIIKFHNDGITKDEIRQELTYKDKQRLSDDTMDKALKSLQDNGFIKGNGKPKVYTLCELPVPAKDIDKTYDVSYAVCTRCIMGNISTRELRLYLYMRYLHNKLQRDGSSRANGNILQINQQELADDLGLTKGRISQMIQMLVDEKILSIWYRQPSENNGFDYYYYRLIY